MEIITQIAERKDYYKQLKFVNNVDDPDKFKI